MSKFIDTDLKEKVEYYCIKCLQHVGDIEDVRISIRNQKSFLSFLGLNDANGISGAKTHLSNRLEYLSKKELKSSPELIHNLNLLKNTLNLTDKEVKILEFFILLNEYRVLNICADFIEEDLKNKDFFRILADILDLDFEDVKAAFLDESPLICSSIISIDYRFNSFERKAEFNNDEISTKMLDKKCTIDELFKDHIISCGDSSLSIKDYDQIKDELNLTLDFLKNSTKKGEKGVNILFYGKPGTGKTELCKVIAKELNFRLFEILSCDDNYKHGHLGEFDRLKLYTLAQYILGKNDLLLYDEAEDIFNTNSYEKRQIAKAHINKLLESNKIPTIWITNKVHTIDEAILRRFSFVIQFKSPDKKTKLKMIKNSVATPLNQKLTKKLINHDGVTPGLLSSTSRVVSNLNVSDKNKAFEIVINNHLKANDYEKLTEPKRANLLKLPQNYDPNFINSDFDLNELVKGIKDSKSARICLYGAPGTGKSAYAKYIAYTLKKPIIIKKCSDLLSKWVGENEKNIAAAFSEAKEERAILVFDEVDSFLIRRDSQNSNWENTMVNEMLVQMESFKGVFIATTNLIDSLDEASLRRFDLKLLFGYLTPNQTKELLKKECESYFINLSDEMLKKVENFSYLTPGDFATIKRQAKFSKIKDENDFYERLEKEVLLKSDYNHKIVGF